MIVALLPSRHGAIQVTSISLEPWKEVSQMRERLVQMLRNIPPLLFVWRLFRSLVVRAVRQQASISEDFRRALALSPGHNASPKSYLEDHTNDVQSLSGPLVTVIVPFYNDESYLEMTLSTLCAQDYVNFECLLIDDHSKDGAIAIARTFCRKDKRFKLITHGANSGLAACRNTGLVQANGQLITFLDADDLLRIDSLSTRVKTLANFNTVDVAGVYCARELITETHFELSCSKKAPNMGVKDFVTEKGDVPFSCHQPLLKTDVVRKFGGFNETLTQAEDWELWNRILRHGYCFVPSLYSSVFYRMKLRSMLTSGFAKHLVNSRDIFFSAHRELQQDEIVPDTPYVYRRPWSYYSSHIIFARRAISFSATADDFNGFIAWLGHIVPEDCIYPISRHTDITGSIIEGWKRSTGMLAQPNDLSRYFMGADRILSSTAMSAVKRQQHIPHRPLPDSDLSGSLWEQPGRSGLFDVLFIPHKDYHVDSVSRILPHLDSRKLKSGVVDISKLYRDEGVRRATRERGITAISVTLLELNLVSAKVVVCFNDWDPIVNGLLRRCKEAGIATVGIVEGVQDYEDVDTGRRRNSYKTVDVVFLAGEFDEKYFADFSQVSEVVGLPNVEMLWERPYKPAPCPKAIINVNFSYNVLTQARDYWLESAVEACEAANLDYAISQHPADNGDLSGYNVSHDSIYDLLEGANILISRFSTVILEALAYGRHVAYHNPHGEKVDKFVDPLGAYHVTRSTGDLAEVLRKLAPNLDDQRYLAMNFLAHHCGIGGSNSSCERIAERLAAISRAHADENHNNPTQRLAETTHVKGNKSPN